MREIDRRKRERFQERAEESGREQKRVKETGNEIKSRLSKDRKLQAAVKRGGERILKREKEYVKENKKK